MRSAVDLLWSTMQAVPRRPSRLPQPDDVGRILVMRECCIGDVLMMTPMLANLKRSYRKAQIHFATGDWSRPVLEDHCLIDRLLSLDGYGRRTGRRLAGGRYDIAVAGDVGTKAMLAARASGAKIRVGFDVGGRGRLLTLAVPKSPDDERHEREAYLDLVRALGLPVEDYPLHMDIGSESRAWAAEALERYLSGAGLGPAKPVAALFPGGGRNPGTNMPSKRWPAGRFAELADALIDKYHVNVLLLGSPDDVTVVADAMSQMRHRAADATGQTTLKQTAALLERCRLFVGNDSGPMHMAAALGVRTVSVFGPTPAAKLAPSGPGHRSVASDVPCSPCYKLILNTFEECDGPECMAAIPVGRVLQAVGEVWSEEPLRVDPNLCSGKGWVGD